jgi:hypothetical protein
LLVRESLEGTAEENDKDGTYNSTPTRVETAYAIARELGCSLAELFDFTGASELDRERRGRYLNLLEMLRPLDIQMLEAATAQLEILLRVRERTLAGAGPAPARKKRK